MSHSRYLTELIGDKYSIYHTEDISLIISQWRYLTVDIWLVISYCWHQVGFGEDPLVSCSLSLSPLQLSTKVFDPNCRSNMRRRRYCKESLWHPTPLPPIQHLHHHSNILYTLYIIHRVSFSFFYFQSNCTCTPLYCNSIQYTQSILFTTMIQLQHCTIAQVYSVTIHLHDTGLYTKIQLHHYSVYPSAKRRCKCTNALL